jgi:hypothetical protein
MSMNNLSSVAAAVIDSYGHTALNVIHAYRAGGERVIGFVDQRFEAVVNADAVKLGEPLRSNLIDTQQRLSGYSTQGLHFGTERAASAVNSAVDLAHKGARRIAANAERFDQATQLGALEAINRVALPAATALSQVIERIEQGSSQLAKRVAGKSAAAKAVAKKAKAVKKTVKKPVKKTATQAAKATTQAATQAATQVASPAAQPAQATRKTVVRKTTAVARKARAAVAGEAAAA